jgi:hypothetical protein
VIRSPLPHDVVRAHTSLERWVEVRSGKDAMTVNQVFDHAGRAENGKKLCNQLDEATLTSVIFQEKVLLAYHEHCALCHLRHRELLCHNRGHTSFYSVPF